MTYRSLLRTGTILVAAGSLTLAGCSKSADKDATATDTATTVATSTAVTETSATETSTETETSTVTATTTAAAEELNASNFHLHDGFVKAVAADKKMTAVFGVLENHTDKAAHLVGFSTDLDASKYEIHEVVDGTMREKEGGIVIEPNSKFVLKPGGDHLMIMGLKQAVEAGSTITVTLKFEDGANVVIKDVPARTIGAGDENYGGDEHADHGTMEMDHDHGTMEMDHSK